MNNVVLNSDAALCLIRQIVTAMAMLHEGNMIVADVFTTSGFALGDLGSPFRVLAAWLIGGLLPSAVR